MNVIKWLNENQGFVMSLLTAVYVIATIVIVYYNRKSIKEMKESREAESRPYVFANLQKDPRDTCFYFRIKNYGKSVAKIDSIVITPKLKLVENDEHIEFLKNVVLAPNQIMQFIVLEEWDITSKNNYAVDIKYISISEKKCLFQENYVLSVQYAHQMGYTDHKKNGLKDGENALNNIANHLDSIRNKL
jgi:hypothetical protein